MSEQNQGPDQVPEEFPLGPGTTGRYVIVTAPAQRVEQDAQQGLTTLSSVANVSPDAVSEAGEVDTEALTNPEASVDFPDLGILVAGGGDRAAVQNLLEKLAAADLPLLAAEVAPAAAFDESQTSWGVQVTKAATSRFSGRGIKVAVLD